MVRCHELFLVAKYLGEVGDAYVSCLARILRGVVPLRRSESQGPLSVAVNRCGGCPDHPRPAIPMGSVLAVNAFDAECAVGQERVLFRDGPWSRSGSLRSLPSWAGGYGPRRRIPQIRQPGVLVGGGCGPRRGLQCMAKVRVRVFV